MKTYLSIALIAISVVIFGFRISKNVELSQNVTGYLKRAANANTITLANEELSKSIAYLEANNLTTGYTSILWETPDEDLDFWYRNLKASQSELENLEPESALEKTNVLLKLHESLIGSGGNRVTVPEGLAVYPNNLLWAILLIIAIVGGFTGLMILAFEADKKTKAKAAALNG